MSHFRSKALLIGKSLAVKDWERPSILMKARKLAHEGAGLLEIAEVLGWGVTLPTVRRRLAKKNIIPLNLSDRRHLGIETHFPEENSISQRSFTPKYRSRA